MSEKKKFTIDSHKKLNSHVSMLLTSIYEGHKMIYGLRDADAKAVFVTEILENLDALETSVKIWNDTVANNQADGFVTDSLSMNANFITTVSRYIDAQKYLDAVEKRLYN